MTRIFGYTLAALVFFALVVRGIRSDSALSRYESRARAAEEYAQQQGAVVAMYQKRVALLERETARRDTVLVVKRERVAAVDASNPPPDSCAPNLAARDDLIAEQGAQIAALDSLAVLRGRALSALQSSHDTLLHVLADRPRPSKWHGPSVAFGPFMGWCASGPCVGVGVTVTVGGRKL